MPTPVVGGQTGSGRAGATRQAAQRVRGWLPAGATLPDDVWQHRHRWILGVLWVHVPALAAFSLVQGQGLGHSLAEAGLVAGFAAGATAARRHRGWTTVGTALGLLTASAVLVHLSGGAIEMHFHYFVVVGIVTLYQEWRPFLIAIGYVVVQHGLAGAVSAESVYNHPDAIAHPWKWAAVHGVFILAMSAAGIASWRLNEVLIRRTVDREDDLRDALSLLDAALDSTADGILVVDLDGRITSFNKRFVEMWGLPDEIVRARDDDGALEFVRSQVRDADGFEAKVRELYADPEAESQDVIEFLDGRVMERHSRPQRVADTTVGRVWSFRDVTDRERLESELAHLALHDSLTHLANQVLFRDRVDHALARTQRNGTPIAVLFFDLDNFKTVNDSLGHHVGDEMLVAVAGRVRSSIRTTDTAARLGGDEFAVLLEGLESKQDALDVAERLIAEMRRPLDAAGREVVVSASIGIAFGGDGTRTDQLLRNADLAMYTAKRRGKGRYDVFETAMHTAAVDRLELEADLRGALAGEELAVHYQPIVELRTGRITAVEALVRWPHPRRGMLPPDTFVPLAEETGLIHALGRQVLMTACRDLSRWQALVPEPLSVSVNLSPRQLREERLVLDVAAALATSKLAPESLVLEITEGAMMHNTDAVIEKLEALKELGVRLAVDDFGTGYSSLSYLHRFPVDILKIDRTFVSDIESAGATSLALTIVSLARMLELQTVAEGVETEAQRLLLDGMGCPFAQGYHFARPMDGADLEALLTGAAAEAPLTA